MALAKLTPESRHESLQSKGPSRRKFLTWVALGGTAVTGASLARFIQNFESPPVQPIGPMIFPVPQGHTIEDLVNGVPGLMPKSAQELAMIMREIDSGLRNSRLPGITEVDTKYRDQVIVWGPKAVSSQMRDMVLLTAALTTESLGNKEMQRRIEVYSKNAGDSVALDGKGPRFKTPDVDARVQIAIRNGLPHPGAPDVYAVKYKGEQRLISTAVARAVIGSIPEAIELLCTEYARKNIPLPTELIPIGSGATGQLKVELDEKGRILAVASDLFETMHIYQEAGISGQDAYVEAYLRLTQEINSGRMNGFGQELRSLYQQRILEQTGENLLVKLPDNIGHHAMLRTVFKDGEGVITYIRWLEIGIKH